MFSEYIEVVNFDDQLHLNPIRERVVISLDTHIKRTV